jgi:nucleolar GTP-binding protein
MQFDRLPKVDDYQFYLDVAITRARLRADELAATIKKQPPVQMAKRIELSHIQVVANTLKSKLLGIVSKFPGVSELDPFYQELIAISIDLDQYRKSLAAIKWAADKLDDISKNALWKVKGAQSVSDATGARKSFYGRASSIMKQVKKDFAILEEQRKIIRHLPIVKTGVPTCVIAGFPNVGKSTLLGVLTGSHPRVAHYPFTTLTLMIGYRGNVQFIDTPGLLDRALDKRNDVERRSILALKFLAHKILFMLDPSTTCGYTLDAQLDLLRQVKAEFDIPIVVVSNKSDLGEMELPPEAADAIMISSHTKEGVDKVIEALDLATEPVKETTDKNVSVN